MIRRVLVGLAAVAALVLPVVAANAASAEPPEMMYNSKCVGTQCMLYN